MDKVVIVTGASRGIGREIAKKLAIKGYKVVANYNKSENEINNLKKELENQGIAIECIQGDVSKREDAKKITNFALEKFKKIDILINNAGVSQFKEFTQISDQDWNYMINTNLNSVFYMTQEVCFNMIKNKKGCIINMSSIWGLVGSSCEVHYSVSKAGIDAMTKALAKELGPSNIRVNSIAPGIIDTDKIIVLPSGYRKDRIYQRDKFAARKRLNLPLNKFIVGFCGSYDDRKGILRLEKAIDEIQDTDIVLAAVGKGNFEPTSSKCVLKGPVNHVDLAWFYSAIDVFAFPTYHEGCCTAIVEAIACGCPVISSDRPFNYEICDHTNSILIEPDDIGAMKRSILKLKNDEKLRHQLSRGSLRRAKELSLDEKAKKILDFVGSRGA